MKAKFTLEIHGGRLFVLGEIPYTAGKEFPQIVLNKYAKVKSMSLNEEQKFEKKADPKNDYFVIYVINNRDKDGTIRIEYDTPVAGENNIIDEDVLAISLYSNAFPGRLPDYIQKSTCYLQSGFENYEVINSYFDQDTGLFAKDTVPYFGEIVNIAGFRKGNLRSFENGKIKVFYRKEDSYKNLLECTNLGIEAFTYYNEIYPHKEMKEITLIVLGIGQTGMYNRGNMIVAGDAPEDFKMPQEMPEDFPLSEDEYRKWLKYSMFTHELGHVWFCNADTGSYEDWLNETGAEWSSLLFLLHKGKKELFQKFYSLREYEHITYGEAIKPEDLHKPASVHGSGVVLFYMIYEKWGKDMVVSLLQILSRLEEQNTEDFLFYVEKELGKEISDFIKDRLNHKFDA